MLTLLTRPNGCRSRWAARFSRVSFLLLAAAIVTLTGCKGDTSGPKNSVSGKVTLGEKEPVAGVVVFVGSDNTPKESPIKADGTYQIADPPKGTCKVVVKPMGAVTTPGGGGTGPMAPPKGSPEMAGNLGGGAKGAPPPQKYQDAKSTPLTFEVKEGKQTFDIKLEQ